MKGNPLDRYEKDALKLAIFFAPRQVREFSQNLLYLLKHRLSFLDIMILEPTNRKRSDWSMLLAIEKGPDDVVEG